MEHLILIKHAMPHIDTSKSSRYWELSPEGRQNCIPLAEAIKTYSPQQMITSDEPKARDTGQIIANHLNIPCSPAPNLHEHDRQNAPFIANKAQWRKIIQTFFAQPNDLIFGNETATQARERFTQAIHHTLTNHTGTFAITTHGTVISLFVAQKNKTNGFDLWCRLTLPSAVILNRTTFEFIDVIENIDNNLSTT